MIDVTVPLEQEGTQAVVRAWLKRVGDRVEVNDPLVELETDKVTMEVPAPSGGVLAEICLDSGAEAPPGTLLARIRLGGGAVEGGAEHAVEPHLGHAGVGEQVVERGAGVGLGRLRGHRAG